MTPDLLLLIALMALVFWLFLVRPQTKRRKEFVQMQSDLEPGARVMLAGAGLYGTVQRVDDLEVDLEIAPGVVVTVHRHGIGRIIPEPDPADATDELETGDDEQSSGPSN